MPNSPARIRPAGTLLWLGFDRVQPNRWFCRASIVESMHCMVLRRPVKLAALTGEVDFGRRGSPSFRTTPTQHKIPRAPQKHRDSLTSNTVPGQLVLALSHFCSYVQLAFFHPTGTLGQEQKNMKRFGKFRDPRFVLTTLQNPTWEVRTRAELIQAAQDALTHQPDAAELPFAGRPAAPVIPPPTPTIPPPVAAAPHAEPQPQPQAQPEHEPEPEPAPQSQLELQREPQLEPHPLSPTASDVVPVTAPLPHVVAEQPAKPKRKDKPRPKRQPQPVRFAKIIPGGAAAGCVAASFDRHASKAGGPHRHESSDLPALERHSRKCAICHHPNRADMEEAFVNWRNADLIQTENDLPNYHTIYRHARALGLYERRRENLRFAAELLVEHADQAQPDANIILRALHACARINDRGEWVEPVRRIIASSGEPQPAFAPAPQLAPQPQFQQLAPEAAPSPQFSAPISINTDANPPFLINGPTISK